MNIICNGHDGVMSPSYRKKWNWFEKCQNTCKYIKQPIFSRSSKTYLKNHQTMIEPLTTYSKFYQNDEYIIEIRKLFWPYRGQKSMTIYPFPFLTLWLTECHIQPSELGISTSFYSRDSFLLICQKSYSSNYHFSNNRSIIRLRVQNWKSAEDFILELCCIFPY